MQFPDAARVHPITLPDGSEHPGTVHLAQVIEHRSFHVGDYTYATDFNPPQDWATHLAPYLFPFGREQLHIGKFCQIAHGVRFITSGANHAMDGLTTYPFNIFDTETMLSAQPDARDTLVGNDVWLGYGALVLPGATIGNGVIVGAGAVVRGTIPDYTIVTGNPAQVARMRFNEDEIARLNAIAWWNWEPARIAAAREALTSGTLDALEAY